MRQNLFFRMRLSNTPSQILMSYLKFKCLKLLCNWRGNFKEGETCYLTSSFSVKNILH